MKDKLAEYVRNYLDDTKTSMRNCWNQAVSPASETGAAVEDVQGAAQP